MHINYTFFTKTKIRKYALSSKKQYRNGGSSEEIEEVSYLNPSASHIAAFSSLRSHITASSVSTLSSRRLPLFRGLKVKLSFTTRSLGSVTSSSRLTVDSLCARLRTLLLKALCLLMGKQTVGKHIQCEARVQSQGLFLFRCMIFQNYSTGCGSRVSFANVLYGDI